MNFSSSTEGGYDGKVAIVTGANSGIGYYTAIGLAKRGFTVILACRNENKAISAANKIKFLTRNKNINPMEIDLSDFQSVKDFAKSFKEKYSRLDVLINNAGCITSGYEKNKNGIEMQFAVNHLGHFLLTNLLLDVIKKSAPSRVINVSSSAYKRGKMEWDDLNLEEKYSATKAYLQSKLANVLFTVQLAHKLEGYNVTVVSVNPGTVKTEINRNNTGFFGCLFKTYMWCFGVSPRKGSLTTLYCSIADEIQSGAFYSESRLQSLAKNVTDEDAEKLWKISLKLVGVKK